MAEKIKVKIAGRLYPLTIKPEEESFIRNAAKRIDTMIQNYEQNYAVSDKQDALAMSVLQLASLLEKQKEANAQNLSTISKKISELENITDSAIQK